MPDVCFAIKYPIQNLSSKKLEIDTAEIHSNLLGDHSFVFHEGIKCEETKDEIIGARYFTHCIVSENVEKRFNYSEDAFFKS